MLTTFSGTVGGQLRQVSLYFEDKTCNVCYFYVKHVYLQLNLRDVFIHLVFIVPYKDPFFGCVGFVSPRKMWIQ
jgi:hypothetical protein